MDEDIKDSSSEESITAVYPFSEIQAHTDSVGCVCLHPVSADIYASGGIDDMAYLYIDNDVKELLGHTDSVVCVCFSVCGEYLAAGSMDGSVSV